MSQAFAPRGTQLQHSPDGATYTKVTEVKKIQSSGSKADMADVTNMDSPSSYREFLATLVDAGEITLDTNFVPGDPVQQALAADFDNQTLGYYKIVLPGALGNASFRAYVTSKDFDLPIANEGTRALKLKITGPMTTNW
ncbi:MAG: phage tail tube protein [Candidatus Acidiferrales bacterium]